MQTLNKLAELKQTRKLVQKILETNIRARNSDSYLYFVVISIRAEEKGINLKSLSVTDYLLNMQDMGFPPFESVRRSRQHLQAAFPELAGSEAVQEARSENEAAYVAAFARG